MNGQGLQRKRQRKASPLPAFADCYRLPSLALMAILLFGAARIARGIDASPSNPGGTLHLARTTDPQTLDLTRMLTVEDLLLAPLLYLPLLDVENGTNLVPCGASAWSHSADYRAFTFELRPGVRFSDGRPAVAADYVCALERLLLPTSGSTWADFLTGIHGAEAFVKNPHNHLAGAKAPSASTLSVELDAPDPTFPYVFTVLTALPQEHLTGQADRYAAHPVCTGPYTVKKWVRGASLTLSPNPYYNGPEPRHLDAIEILIGGDETTHLMMFEHGELDLANTTGAGVPRSSFRRFAHDPRWRHLIDRAPCFGTRGLVLNTEVPPLDNILVRQAINCAIDRDRRMQVVLGLNSHAEGMIPPGMPGYNPELRGYPFDPARARELIRQSGLPLPLRTQLWHGTTDEMRTMAQGIQWDLRQVGIEAELVPLAYNQLVIAACVRGKVPMALSGYIATVPDPKDILGYPFDGRSIARSGSLNMAFYSNPGFNHLLDVAALETDPPSRANLYHQAEELLLHDAPWAFLGHYVVLGLRQPWLKGRLMDPTWWYRLDRVWIEK